MSDAHALVVVKGSKTGLGDRIRAVLVGLLYAQATGRRVYVDWRDGMYGPAGENIFDRLLRLRDPGLGSAPPAADCDSVAPPAWKGRLGRSMDAVYCEDGAPPWDRDAALRTYSVDVARLDHTEHVAVVWEFTQLDRLRPTLADALRRAPAEDIERWAWQHHLALAPSLERAVADFFSGVTAPTLGVHVRATVEFAQQKGGIALSQYFDVIDRELRREPRTTLVVATDNSDVLHALRARYPSVRARDKWFAAPGQPLHLQPGCPDPARSAEDAIIEMALLARCDRLVSVANSSYSVVARLMSRAAPGSHILMRPHTPMLRRIWNRAARAVRAGSRGAAAASNPEITR